MISVKSKPSAAGGFTLIELMIVVAIVAILAAIAIPGMRKYVERARHAEAAAALSSVQLDMERWRSENPEYPTAADHATAIPRNLDTPSYTIEVTASDAVSYSLEATIKDGIDDETCASMTIDYADGGTTRAPASCF